jgi:hypothetical protein
MAVGAETTAADPAAAALDYQQLTRTIREVVQSVLPSGAIVAVVSRGDDQLLSLGDRVGWHFPQDAAGQYTGYHPSDSTAAIAHLEDVRERGADYLLLPSTALWWLDYYTGLREHLEENYPLVVNREDVCLAFQLSERGLTRSAHAATGRRREAGGHFVQQFRDLLANLLPAGSIVAVASLGDRQLLQLDGLEGKDFPGPGLAQGSPTAPYLDALASLGVDFLVIPRPAFAWLAQEPELAQRLAAQHRFVTRQEHLCEVYELNAGNGSAAPAEQAAQSEQPDHPQPIESPQPSAGFFSRIFGSRPEQSQSR